MDNHQGLCLGIAGSNLAISKPKYTITMFPTNYYYHQLDIDPILLLENFHEKTKEQPWRKVFVKLTLARMLIELYKKMYKDPGYSYFSFEVKLVWDLKKTNIFEKNIVTSSFEKDISNNGFQYFTSSFDFWEEVDRFYNKLTLDLEEHFYCSKFSKKDFTNKHLNLSLVLVVRSNK